ncbi:hypothetical protein BGZ83_000751 [Gryganskiella cystojenkinii]|nr:hypothetical protein BGZ83_000751 [Gryganskiella cystojenkinii]
MYSQHQQQQPLSNLSRSLPPTPSQLHPAVLHEADPVPDDYFAEAEDVPLPFPIQTIVADPQTGLSLTLISALGAGSYAVVYLAKELASGTLYALKCLGKDKLTEEEVAIQRNEVVIHTSLPRHRNIIHLLNMFETTNHLFLLLEYSSGMDMYQWISMRSDNSDPVTGEPYTLTTRYEVIKTVFDQVLEGVHQVHQCGIAHRDLKPENFLIEFADGQYTVKITDFGLATTDTESDEFECGSKPYMSFECRNGLDSHYDVQMADLWSLGIILINLLYHRCPWSDPCPLESYAFSEFLRGRVDFLQRRFEDMPGPVARWLGLKAFSFAAFDNVKKRKHNRPRLKDWKEWMEDFVPRMLGQIGSCSDDEDDEDGEYETGQEDRKFLALFEDDYVREDTTVGREPDVDEGEKEDNQVVPIAIQSSSLKAPPTMTGYLSTRPQYSSYHNPQESRNANVFISSSVPKFDPSSFYQPTRLRQESWSDAIDMEAEDADMDFSAAPVFEESEEDLTQEDDDDDTTGLAMAFPDDFIDPLPASNTTSGRQTPSTPTVSHLTFNSEKRHILPQLRLDLDAPSPRLFQDAVQGGRASPGRVSPSRRSPGRNSPSVEMGEINTLVFIEPDVSRTPHDGNATPANGHAIASSLPSTSHLEAAMQSKVKERTVLKNHMKKPQLNLQEVKAAPFVFPPLKTNTPNLQPMTAANSGVTSPKAGQAPSGLFNKIGVKESASKDISGPASKQGLYVIPKRSAVSGWSGTGPGPSRPTESNPATYANGVRNSNRRGAHHRGGSSASIEDMQDMRRGSTDRYRGEGYRAGSGRIRTRMDDRDDGPGGLPPRAENKFRPRFRQGRRYPANSALNSALPPAPPTTARGGAPRSRHQSRSGTVFDHNSSWSQHPALIHGDYPKPVSKDTPRDNPQPQPKYEHSQLRTHAKTASSGGGPVSKLSSQRNKSLVDLRAIDVTNQPWRQTSTPATPVIPKTKSQAGGSIDRTGLNVHPLEQTEPPSPVKSRLSDRSQDLKDAPNGDNVYHPPHWHERRSVSNAGASPRPISGTENDFMGWQKHDGLWTEGHSNSRSQRSGSRGRHSNGPHPLAGVPTPSPTPDRKYAPPRTTDSNWREGGRESFSISELRGETPNKRLHVDQLSTTDPLIVSSTATSSSSVSAPPTLSKASLQTTRHSHSPVMTFTPPTPSVSVKSEFLSGSGSVANNATDALDSNGEAKKIVRPGAMAGLGNMLRGLVAYNKNIKVGGEGVSDSTTTATSTVPDSPERTTASIASPNSPIQKRESD